MVCLRPSELPLPSRLDFLRQLSAHTRVVPVRDAMLSEVETRFDRVARTLLAPFGDGSVQGRLQLLHTSPHRILLTVGNVLLKTWV